MDWYSFQFEFDPMDNHMAGSVANCAVDRISILQPVVFMDGVLSAYSYPTPLGSFINLLPPPSKVATPTPKKADGEKKPAKDNLHSV